MARSRIFGIANHAHDAESARVLRQVDAEVFTKRLFSGKETSHECLIYYCDAFGISRIGVRKASAAKHGLPNRLEMIGAHAVPRCHPLFVHLRGRMSIHIYQLAPIAHHGSIEREGGMFYAGNAS